MSFLASQPLFIWISQGRGVVTRVGAVRFEHAYRNVPHVLYGDGAALSMAKPRLCTSPEKGRKRIVTRATAHTALLDKTFSSSCRLRSTVGYTSLLPYRMTVCAFCHKSKMRYNTRSSFYPLQCNSEASCSIKNSGNVRVICSTRKAFSARFLRIAIV